MDTNFSKIFGLIHWQMKCKKIDTRPNFNAKTIALNELEKNVRQCKTCDLHKNRTQTVFGVGNIQAKVMIVGEAPGFYEDQKGQPFVGRSGQLLMAMIKSIGFQREDVYIANVLKCRPPDNRDPTASEVTACSNFLNQQIQIITPKVLFALGRIAAYYLLKKSTSLDALRLQKHVYGELKTPLIISYHPAYLLRNPLAKKKALKDLLFLHQQLMDHQHGRVSETTATNL